MKRLILLTSLLVLTAVIFSACQPGDQVPTDPAAGPTDDGLVVYGEEATFESIEVLILESFPVQVLVNVTGYLLDGCVTLDEIVTARDGFEFTLKPITYRPAGDVECTEALVPFEESVALDVLDLPAGTYTVKAQEQRTTFVLSVDNSLEEPIIGEQEGGEGANFDSGIVYLDSMAINVMESFPVQVSVTLTGNLADGCTKIDSIKSEREGQTFTIQIKAQRPSGQMCTQALVPFEKTVTLDVYGLPAGDYSVIAGDLSESFTLEMDNTP